MNTIKPQLHLKNKYIEALRTQFKPGDTIYTVLRHASTSGMTRDITCFTINDDKSLSYCTYQVAQALGESIANEGVRVQGAGMDMGFDLIYRLSYELFGDGYALNQRWV